MFQSLELNRASGNRQGESVCLVNLGTTCEMLDQLDKAIEYHTLVSFDSTVVTEYNINSFMQYLSAKVETGCLLGQARALSTLAGIYEESNQMMKAHDHYRKVKSMQKYWHVGCTSCVYCVCDVCVTVGCSVWQSEGEEGSTCG